MLGHTKRDTLAVPDFWQERKVLKHGDSIMRFLSARAPKAEDTTAGTEGSDLEQ